MKAIFKYILWGVMWCALFLWLGLLENEAAQQFVYIQF
jgi:hypothetical protein